MPTMTPTTSADDDADDDSDEGAGKDDGEGSGEADDGDDEPSGGCGVSGIGDGPEPDTSLRRRSARALLKCETAAWVSSVRLPPLTISSPGSVTSRVSLSRSCRR